MQGDIVKKLSNFFKALACEWRIKIVEIVGEGKVGQAELVKKISIDFTTLSRHLKVLKDSEILIERKEGERKLYSVRDMRVLEIVKLSKDLLRNDIER